MTRTVIATGGGMMAQPAAERELLHSDPKVFWLTATPEELVRRLRAIDNKSPLITSEDPERNMGWFLRLRASIFDVYERVDTTGRTPKQVAETLRRKFLAHCRTHAGSPRNRASAQRNPDERPAKRSVAPLGSLTN